MVRARNTCGAQVMFKWPMNKKCKKKNITALAELESNPICSGRNGLKSFHLERNHKQVGWSHALVTSLNPRSFWGTGPFVNSYSIKWHFKKGSFLYCKSLNLSLVIKSTNMWVKGSLLDTLIREQRWGYVDEWEGGWWR